jgi:hypothetical protein
VTRIWSDAELIRIDVYLKTGVVSALDLYEGNLGENVLTLLPGKKGDAVPFKRVALSEANSSDVFVLDAEGQLRNYREEKQQ